MARSKLPDENTEQAAARVMEYKRKLRKLKPSGCLTSMFIDPDVSEEEDENNVVARKMREEKAKDTAQKLKEQ